MGRVIALLFYDLGTRRGWVVSSTPRPHFTLWKDPVPILQEAGWAPRPVWTGGKSRPPGIRSRTVRSVAQSLYRLSYLAHTSSVHFVNSEPVPFGFIWTGLSAEQQRILRVCFPEKTDVYLSHLTRNGSWTHPASFPRYWRLFRWTKQPRRDSDHSPHCMLRLRMRGAITPLPLTCSLRCAWVVAASSLNFPSP